MEVLLRLAILQRIPSLNDIGIGTTDGGLIHQTLSGNAQRLSYLQNICAEIISQPQLLASHSISLCQFTDGVAGLNDDLLPRNPVILWHRS